MQGLQKKKFRAGKSERNTQCNKLNVLAVKAEEQNNRERIQNDALPATNGHQLTALVSACRVVQNRSVVDECIQFTANGRERERQRDRETERDR